LMDLNFAVDVRDVLGAVRVPTLVLHRTGDALFKVGEARYLADHIPSARLQLLEGADHLVSGDPDQILAQIEPFIRTLRPTAPEPVSLAAVVAAAGESQMQVIDDLVAAGARARATPSGRRVALFDGPATAVRCGLASLRDGARLGVAIAGVPRTRRRWTARGCATPSESPTPQMGVSCGSPPPPESSSRAAACGCCRFHPETRPPGSPCFASSHERELPMRARRARLRAGGPIGAHALPALIVCRGGV